MTIVALCFTIYEFIDQASHSVSLPNIVGWLLIIGGLTTVEWLLFKLSCISKIRTIRYEIVKCFKIYKRKK